MFEVDDVVEITAPGAAKGQCGTVSEVVPPKDWLGEEFFIVKGKKSNAYSETIGAYSAKWLIRRS